MNIHLVAFVAITAICEGVPTVPRDNSHYVEGESRYFWMSEGDGEPTLVDLQEPVDTALLGSSDGADNQYFLYTRDNPTDAQLLIYGNASSISSSNYNAELLTMFVVHGWMNSVNSSLNPTISEAFLSVYDGNVIVVDWSDLAGSGYVTASAGVPSVGEYLGEFLAWLIATAGGSWDNVHLVGHSLGAHVVGNAGRTVGGAASRVTGLDPAGPTWTLNSNAINAADGQYVEAIHTDGLVLGIYHAVGHVDIYPNHGTNPQPGCLLSTCSHSRAWELFASSIENSDRFNATLCSSMLAVQLGICSGEQLAMGNAIVDKRGTSGVYFLTTGSEYPYYED